MHLRSIDLNLLPVLFALLEERSVTRAGHRIHLTQSATSRALERLRGLLKDDLLVRSLGDYVLTPRGDSLLRELRLLLPRLEYVLGGEDFSPERTQGRVRLAMTDYAAVVILPYLMPELERLAPGLRIEISHWRERAYEDLTSAAVDLVFSPLAFPSSFKTELLFEEERFVCLVREAHPLKGRTIPLGRYLGQRHISVETEPNQLNLIERALKESGLSREIVLHLPYIQPAILALEHSNLVLTTPARIAKEAVRRYPIRKLTAPVEIPAFQYTMIWHPRLEQEPLHSWFRSVVRDVCARLA